MVYNFCSICGKEMYKKGNNLAHQKICNKCLHKLPLIYRSFKVLDVECFAIYSYNEFLREIIYQIKASYDLDLAKTILLPCKEYLSLKYKNYTLIPMPSSKSSDAKRGFNHVVEIFKVLGLKFVFPFAKKDNYKQSNSNKIMRSNIAQHLLFDATKLNGCAKYLIVDDITTTHETLRTAIRNLRSIGIKNIKVLVLCIKERK